MRLLCTLLAASLLLTAAPVEESLSQWRLEKITALEATLHHVQGIDVEDGVLWVSSVDRAAQKGYLSRFELASGRLLQQVEVQEGLRYHPGGIALDGDSIWVPVAEYDRGGPATIQRRDKTTLELLSSFTVNDHIGCIAAGPDGLIGGNWDSRTLYRWTFDGAETARTANPHATSYQDLKWVEGNLLGSGGQGRDAGAVDWLEPNSYELVRRLSVHRTDRDVSFTNEGMALRDGTLYLLPEDDPSRLFVFTPPAQR
jgi:hypothetical protein